MSAVKLCTALPAQSYRLMILRQGAANRLMPILAEAATTNQEVREALHKTIAYIIA